MRAVLTITMTLLAAAQATARAEPACRRGALAAAVGAGKLGTFSEDDSPAGTSAAASVQVTPRVGGCNVWLGLRWATMRDDFYDPFDPVVYDVRLHWLEASLAYQRYLGERFSAGTHLGIGAMFVRQSSPEDDSASAIGPAFGLRAGYDVYQGEREALGIYAEADLLFVGAGPLPFGAAAATLGVAYQRR